jgi:hypothetical protein
VWGGGVSLMRVAGTAGTAEMAGGAVTVADASGARPVPPVRPESAPAEPSPDPRERFTHIELGPATTQATILRDLVLGATPSCDIAPATFADGVACMEVLDAMRRSAAAGGQLVEVGQ